MPPKKKKRKGGFGSAAAGPPPVWTVTGSELCKAFQHIIYSLPQCHDQWFTAEDWCSILPTYWSSLRNYKDQVTANKFTRAIKGHFGETFGDRGESNPNGVYAYQHGTNNQTRRWCFLITKKSQCPLPPSSQHFFIGDITKILTPSAVVPNNPNNLSAVVVAAASAAARLAESLRKETYLDSPEGWRQFMSSSLPKPTKPKGTKSTGSEVKAEIEARLCACQSGIQDWWKVAEGGTGEDIVTESKKKKITMKCHVVYAALRKALDTMDDNKNRLTWGQCCDYSIEAMKVVGFDHLPASRSVRVWHVELRDNNNKFPHPNEKARKKKGKKEEDAKLEEGEEGEDEDDEDTKLGGEDKDSSE